jgi:hypothetical protein
MDGSSNVTKVEADVESLVRELRQLYQAARNSPERRTDESSSGSETAMVIRGR